MFLFANSADSLNGTSAEAPYHEKSVDEEYGFLKKVYSGRTILNRTLSVDNKDIPCRQPTTS